MLEEKIRFRGAAGHELSGVLHLPEKPAAGAVLMAHCFTCSKDIFTMTRLARGLAAERFAVLRFDFTGLGDSGGEFSGTTVSTNVGDLQSATGILLERGLGPCGMFGHSLGGAAVLLAAGGIPEVRSVAVLGAPSSPVHLKRMFAPEKDRIRREGQAVVQIAGRPFPISAEFLNDLDAHDSRRTIAELGRPLLVCHAVDDEIVGVAEGERIFARAEQPKAFMPLLGTDHLLTDRRGANQALTAIVEWFRNTLGGRD